MARKQIALEVMRAEVLEALIQYRGEKLMEATVAACALVAHADGELAPVERAQMLQFMRADALLSMFPRDEVLHTFYVHAAAFATDPKGARDAALRCIEPLAAHPRQARIVLTACLLLADADGQVHPAERQAVRLVREALGLGPDRGGSADWPALPPRHLPRSTVTAAA